MKHQAGQVVRIVVAVAFAATPLVAASCGNDHSDDWRAPVVELAGAAMQKWQSAQESSWTPSEVGVIDLGLPTARGQVDHPLLVQQLERLEYDAAAWHATQHDDASLGLYAVPAAGVAAFCSAAAEVCAAVILIAAGGIAWGLDCGRKGLDCGIDVIKEVERGNRDGQSFLCLSRFAATGATQCALSCGDHKPLATDRKQCL